LQQPSEKLHCY